MNDLPPQVLVGLVTLTVVVLVRLRPRPARTRRLVVGPCVVMAVGAIVLVPTLTTATPWHPGATVAVVVADVVLTVGLGLARGATVHVSTSRTAPDVAADRVDYRYTAATLVLWVVSVALRFELAGAGARLGAAPAVTEGSVLLALGVSLLTQNLVVVAAAARERSQVEGAEAADQAESTRPARP